MVFAYRFGLFNVNICKILVFGKSLSKKSINTLIMAKIVEKLLSHGYVSLKSKYEKNKTYRECRRLRKKECRARAITTLRNDELIILKETEHSHPPNQE